MNFLDLYFEYARTSTDAPWGYHRVVGLVTAGVAINRKRWIQWGHEKIYPNIYLCLVGPEGIRKTTALICGRDVLDEKIRPEIYLEESAFNQIIKRNCNKRVEFTNLWNDQNVFFSVITAVTIDWFEINTCKKNLQDSLLSRFFYAVEDKQETIFVVPPARNEEFFEQVKKGVAELANLKEQELSLRLDAEQLYSEWAKGMNERANFYPKLRPAFKRLPIYCLKFALIMQTVKDGSSRIDLEVMTNAIKLSDYCYDKARDFLMVKIKKRPDAKWEELENRVLKMLWASPTKELALSWITKKLVGHLAKTGSGTRTQIVHAVLDRLLEKGYVVTFRAWTSAKAWKKAQMYRLTKKEIKTL